MQKKAILGTALASALFIPGCTTPPPPPAAPPVAQPAYNWSAQLETLKRGLEDSTRGSGIRIVKTADNQLQVVLPADASFDIGRSAVKLRMAPILDQIAAGLQNNPAVAVHVIGHTDNTGSDATNDKLSLARAGAVRDHLAAKGLAANQMTVEGKGEHEPIAENSSAAGRAQNRRVEIFVGERNKR
jgi:outer membrane protein OmpA-like peptidoglycan-associated protein